MRRHLLSDAVLALLLGGAAITVLISTAGTPAPRWEPLGPASVPRAVAFALLLLAAIVILQAAWRLLAGTGLQDDVVPELTRKPRYVQTLSVLLATVVAVAVMYLDWAGYRPVIFVLTVFSVLVLSGFSRRMILPTIILASVLSIGVHFVMTEFLSIRLP